MRQLQTTCRLLLATTIVVACIIANATNIATAAQSQAPIRARSPAQTIKATQVAAGYHLQLVLAEPLIQDPVAIAFDGDARMFVAEMRSYMPNIDGTGEHNRTSRVSLHWSSKRNGHYDRHTIFADHLLLPRLLLTLDKNRILIGETDSNDLYIYRDIDGDGVADEKTLFYAGGPRGENLEHQPSGPVWALDNWLYTTYNPYRLRWTPQGPPLKETTAFNYGQWGISQDDWGKLWFVNAAGERGPINFQTGIVYGGFNVPDQFAPGFTEVWPLVGLADVQGGTRRFRPENGTLNHFTATCGGEIYRGDKLPELRGNLLFAEPVGRLIRRATVQVKDGITTLDNPYPQSEFIRSADPLFRPVNLNNGPDGTLYITDMYRGLIQEAEWVKEDSYLRPVVKRHGLEKFAGRGRIYRLVREGIRPAPPPRMNQETPAQLVAHLAHPNGWWRDTAQKLLVIAQDQSVVPALTAMASNHPEPLARLHALWTLEGLGAVTPQLLREKLKDPHPELRAAALRVSETLYKSGDTSWATDIHAATQDPDGNVVLQALLTAKLLNLPDWKDTLTNIVQTNSYRAIAEIGGLVLHPPQRAPRTFTASESAIYESGKTTYQSLCAACHGADGTGLAMAGAPAGSMLAPPLAGSDTVSDTREGAVYVLLHGLSGPIEGNTYEGQMVSMAANDDAWIASVTSYIRNSFGNRGTFVSPEDVAKLRSQTQDRTRAWTIAELRAMHAPTAAAASAQPANPLTAEEIRAITQAVPLRPRARPAKPRRVLVFDRTEGFVHRSIPYANEALKQLGERTGAYAIDVSDNMSLFTTERLAPYDAIVLNNTTKLSFPEISQRQALLDFVSAGKGLAVIHAGADNFYNWPEGEALVGGQFNSHPWNAHDTVAIKVDDPNNPIVAAFDNQGFRLRDEIYQIVGSYSRKSQHVLLSLDMTQPENARPPETIVRTDNDFPIAWIKPHGHGRVFYTSIGHNPDLYHNPQILQHYLDGIQFAIGDLPADSSPSTSPSTGDGRGTEGEGSRTRKWPTPSPRERRRKGPVTTGRMRVFRRVR